MAGVRDSQHTLASCGDLRRRPHAYSRLVYYRLDSGAMVKAIVTFTGGRGAAPLALFRVERPPHRRLNVLRTNTPG